MHISVGAFLGSVAILVTSGTARFSGYWTVAPLWLDTVFLISAATALALAVSLSSRRLHHHFRQDLHDGALSQQTPNRTAPESPADRPPQDEGRQPQRRG